MGKKNERKKEGNMRYGKGSEKSRNMVGGMNVSVCVRYKNV